MELWPNFKKMIGEKIRRRREELGMTSQGKLAEKIPTDTSRVNRWENGHNLPDPAFCERLKEVLDVDDSFFDMETESPEIEELLRLFRKASTTQKAFILGQVTGIVGPDKAKRISKLDRQ